MNVMKTQYIKRKRFYTAEDGTARESLGAGSSINST